MRASTLMNFARCGRARQWFKMTGERMRAYKTWSSSRALLVLRKTIRTTDDLQARTIVTTAGRIICEFVFLSISGGIYDRPNGTEKLRSHVCFHFSLLISQIARERYTGTITAEVRSARPGCARLPYCTRHRHQCNIPAAKSVCEQRAERLYII